ncbi:MAG TPA: hemerythrin domain-containing protein [Blastocatellia bacterium]|jgi:iron-sulfur cluster repair protein YtfE (RIC family)|nr:hemerythrin domain-containing protein [Blastocatellia bacterium]
MNALELLKEDHKKVSDLFAKVEATENEKQHEQLFERIKSELETHTHIEETILYPALQKHEELKDMVLEAFEEHKQVKTLIREIGALADGSERFDAKLKVMGENVEHHVEEEETEMFPKIRRLFSEVELDQIGRELEAGKKEFRMTNKASAK